MRIYILGPSGVGKTTLAKKLISKNNTQHYDLDYLLHKFMDERKGFIDLDEESIYKNIDNILKRKSWVVEGIHIIPPLLDKSDKIIFVDMPWYKAIYRQWKRFFTDKKQRKEHGFVNNLKLTRHILRQYFEEENKSRSGEIQYSRLAKTKRILEKYKDKVENYSN